MPRSEWRANGWYCSKKRFVVRTYLDCGLLEFLQLRKLVDGDVESLFLGFCLLLDDFGKTLSIFG